MKSYGTIDPIIKWFKFNQVASFFCTGICRQVIFDPSSCHHIHFEILDTVAGEFYLQGQCQCYTLYFFQNRFAFSCRNIRVF